MLFNISILILTAFPIVLGLLYWLSTYLFLILFFCFMVIPVYVFTKTPVKATVHGSWHIDKLTDWLRRYRLLRRNLRGLRLIVCHCMFFTYPKI